MPRPRKQRHVCCMPGINEFMPVGGRRNAQDVVLLTVDEYEAIRLIDHEGLSQEECSEHLNVARTTAQQIYATARKKIARALVEGLIIRIGGGDYHLCGGNHQSCGHAGCRRQKGGRMRALEQEESN